MRDALSQLIWNGPRLRGSLPRTLIGALIAMVQGAGPMIGAMIVMGAMVIGAMIEMVQGQQGQVRYLGIIPRRRVGPGPAGAGVLVCYLVITR